MSSILKPRTMSTQSDEEKKRKKDEDEDIPSPYMIIVSQRIDTHPVGFPSSIFASPFMQTCKGKRSEKARKAGSVTMGMSNGDARNTRMVG